MGAAPISSPDSPSVSSSETEPRQSRPTRSPPQHAVTPHRITTRAAQGPSLSTAAPYHDCHTLLTPNEVSAPEARGNSRGQRSLSRAVSHSVSAPSHRHTSPATQPLAPASGRLPPQHRTIRGSRASTRPAATLRSPRQRQAPRPAQLAQHPRLEQPSLAGEARSRPCRCGGHQASHQAP